MKRRRVLIVAAAALCMLASASIAFGQDSLVCAESGSPLKTSSYEIRVVSGNTPKQVKLAFGDLQGQCLPRPVIASLSYVINWVKGGPRPVAGVDTTLVLPASDFTMLDQTVSDRATVVVKQTTLRTDKGAITAGPLTLELARREDVWRVMSITMP